MIKKHKNKINLKLKKKFKIFKSAVQPQSQTLLELDSGPIPCRSTRLSCPRDPYCFSPTSFHATLSSIAIPTCYSETAKLECWWEAMVNELRVLKDNHAQDVPCPLIVKVIDCKWVYSIKLHSDGTLD